MKARKFLVLRGIPATSAKSTFIFYLGHLRDDNLSPTERKFIKAVQDSRSTSYILCDELIHPSSLLCRSTIFGNFKRTKTVVLLDALIEQ